MFFRGKYKGPSIEESLKWVKSSFLNGWKEKAWLNLGGEAMLWWYSQNSKKLLNLPNEEFEKDMLDKWSHARK